MKAKMDNMLDPELLKRYAIVDNEVDFESALKNGGGKIPSGGLVSVKSNRTKVEKHGKLKESQSEKKRSKDGHGSRSNKKKKS